MPTVLVTGAARGIGRTTALRLAGRGWEVFAGVRQAADGVELAATAPAGRIVPIVLDVTDEGQVGALDRVLPARLDAVVNNAGVVVGGPVEGLKLEDLRRQLEVNVVGQVAVTQAVLPRVRESRGRIVFVSSVSGRVSTPMLGAYTASKYAIEAMADALRMELRPWGVAVTLVEPGAIDTAIWQQGLETLDETERALDPEVRRRYDRHLRGMRSRIPRMQKLAGSPESVAEAIEQALTAERAPARVLVGTDAKMQVVLGRLLPTRARDAVFARAVGVPSR